MITGTHFISLSWFLVPLCESLLLLGENMYCEGWTLVITKNSDVDSDDIDNNNITSENPDSGGKDLCFIDLQGCFETLDSQLHCSSKPPI